MPKYANTMISKYMKCALQYSKSSQQIVYLVAFWFLLVIRFHNHTVAHLRVKWMWLWSPLPPPPPSPFPMQDSWGVLLVHNTS